MKYDTKWPGAFSILKLAFAGMKRNPEPMLAIVAIYGLAALADAYTQVTFVSVGSFKLTDPFALAAPLVITLAQTVYALAVADGRTLTVGQLFNGSLKKYISIIVAYILLLIIIIASCFVLAIPLIWFIPWFSFIFYIIVDKGVGPLAAYPASKRLAEHHEGKIWGIIGVTILMSIATIAVSLIPVFNIMASAFVTVISYAMTAMLYRWLQQSGSLAASEGGATEPVNENLLPHPPLPPVK